MSKFQIYPLILTLPLIIASCQSSPTDPRSREIEEIVKNTPPLTRVSWKACGVEKIESMSRSSFNQCLEGTQLVWGPAKEHEMVKTRNFTTGIHIHIFAKSRGCLKMGNPDKEDYYLMKTYPVGLLKDEPKLTTPTADVKFQELTTKEKRQAIASFVNQEPNPLFIGIPNQYSCQSKTNWLRN